ncbi:kinase-like protein [Trametes coccinea BRFM310]|uniref:non-specific serine/threonine protein kinase n=1 Tax=Trametes coccinea (strain BRFM310) TaxID=1353009 RepID=A0A1Y2I895_TRAC3|nr:kinase-like protein [Trametes coccinea BRFM310]
MRSFMRSRAIHTLFSPRKQFVRNLPGNRRFSLSISLQTQPLLSPQTTSARRWEDSEELLEDYDPAINGYYPLKIGDVLGGHYSVVQKLGWGVYSTVWLVKDQQYESPTFRALKVLTRVAMEVQDKLHELDYLQKMQSKSPQHLGYAHVVHLKDHFCQKMMEPLLEDLHLFSLRWKHRLLPLPAVRYLARQIVLGVQYLHDECNSIHTDIKPANILLAPPGDQSSFFTQATLDADVETSDAQGPNGAIVTRVRSNPIPYPIPDWGSNPDSVEPWRAPQAKIGDVGVACWADKVSEHFTELIQSPALRAPEVAIGAGWGKPADVWSLGCTLYELYMGRSLFKKTVSPLSVPNLHTIAFGQYPPSLLQRGKHRDVFFKPDGTLKIPVEETRPFDLYIRMRNAPDAAAFVDFLRRTFALEPAERATCRELLDHPWLNM